MKLFKKNKSSDDTPKVSKKDKLKQMAVETIEYVGKDNITNIDNCITRVRLTVKKNDFIDNEGAKKIGYVGVSKPGNEAVQFIIGPDSEVIANEMKKILGK